MSADDAIQPPGCPWAASHPLLQHHHDTEWGVPLYDDHQLFGALVLETAQTGLSWLAILRKREGYRTAFAGFDARVVAEFTEADVARIVEEGLVIRSPSKTRSVVRNAQALLRVAHETGTFSEWLWDFVGGKPLHNGWKEPNSVPSTTETALRLSRALKQRGFTYVGPVVTYAFMQHVGLVNDHVVGCPRFNEILEMERRL